VVHVSRVNASVSLVAAAIATSCASAPPARPQPARLAEADAQVLQGCYDCLLDARTRFRQLAVGRERRRVLARVFETDLLLALRAKELGLPAADAIDDARRVAAELPRALEAEHYLALVDAVPSDALGVSPREMRGFFTARTALHARLPTEIAWLATGTLQEPVRAYLRLALECAAPSTDDKSPAATAADPPLLAYRKTLCSKGPIEAFQAVRAREPRFVETSYFIADIELVLLAVNGPGQARAHLGEAYGHFPTSPAVTFAIAMYDLAVGDDAEGLAFNDRTLALVPGYDGALRGRTICLTHLGRRTEAIAAATRLIELGNSAADGYYWRAQNHHALGHLPEAHTDILAAKERSLAPDILSLAGMIEHDVGELDPAQADLETATAADPSDCSARWYLGLVHRQRKHGLPSGRAFEDAMTCFATRAETSQQRIQALQARSDLDPAYRVRTITSLEASVIADTRQQHLAALTAANHDATGGDLAAARKLADLAAEDPTLTERAAKLRALIDKGPHAR
jgi:tetratricopeptide (TPR) repeat protein